MAKFTEMVLAALQFQAEGLLTITDMFVSLPIEIRKGLHGIFPVYERHWFKTNWAEHYRNRQQFHKTLQHLKNQGLVARRGIKGGTLWVITKRGKERFERHRQLRADPYSSAHIDFAKPRGLGITVITFDIPEKERRKRDWLRRCLVEMGFKMLQKSVWMAQGAAEEDFIRALRERKLLACVHIFSVTRHGTIRMV